MVNQIKEESIKGRVLSVDFMRGFTMFMLVSNFGQLFNPSSSNSVEAFFGRQLDHAYWEGLTAWDLVQPFFMFIVGVSMPLSFSRKWTAGESWQKSFRGVLKRSALLLFLGWLINSTGTTSSFTNVLAQLSVTYLITFLLLRKPFVWQIIASLLLILFNDSIYTLWPVEGFNQPFTADHNFGSWVDLALTGNLPEDRWVSFNAIPTAAHTIWGALAGWVLIKNWTPNKKALTLFVAGLIGLVIGFLLSTQIPVIKRVCTSSFIFISGGWALIALAASYFVIDTLQHRKAVLFFAIVGMNPLFIYLFRHAGGHHIIEQLASPVIYRIIGWISPATMTTVMVIVVALMQWYICYFLYKKQIFIRI